MNDPVYTICLKCDHFVDENTAWEPNSFFKYGLAPYIHLDDGEKEHNHDASPGGRALPLSEWRKIMPKLFETYPDGKIGPNSRFYRRRS